MSDYDDTNTWVLFKADKQGNENRPDYTGKINIEGRELRLAAWVKTSKSGKKFFSGRVSEFQQQKPQEPAQQKQDDFDDSIPF